MTARRGRVAVIGAGPAGMATEDGYFLGRRLAGVDLSDYAAVRQALQDFETPRKRRQLGELESVASSVAGSTYLARSCRSSQ